MNARPRLLAIAAGASALIVMLTGCGGGGGASSTSTSGSAASSKLASSSACRSIQKKYPALKGKKLTVGVSAGPSSYDTVDPKNPGTIIGVEPDLLETAGSCAGFTVKFVQQDFTGLIPGVQAGRSDLLAGGMYASDERAQQVDFVQYMKAGEASVVAKGNPKHITSMDDACGLSVAEAVGTVENAIWDKQNAACTAAGKKAMTFQSYKGNDQAMNALAQGRVDIFLTDAGVASYLAKKIKKIQVGFPIPSDFVFGFGVSKSKPDTRDALLAALQAMHANGTEQKIITKWGFTKAQIVTPSAKTS